MPIPQRTRFTELVRCRLPLQQAAMGGVPTPELAGAVAAAGGLGMLSGTGLPGRTIADQLAAATATANDTNRRIGVGFIVPFLHLPALEAAADAAPLIECFYGDPTDGLVQRIHDGGALAAWQVGSVDEAQRAIHTGCDLVVVQGTEAGGHVRGHEPLHGLLESIRPITDLPLVAAGGIGDHTTAQAAFDRGADAIRVGTRFVVADEADSHDDYRRALVAAGADDTVITEAFSTGWPDAPHRVLEQCLLRASGNPMTPSTAFTGDIDTAALYAGTSVEHVTCARQPAAHIVSEILGLS